MATSRSECPSCRSSKNVRLLSDTGAYFKYWCGACRKDFKIPKGRKELKNL